ncbi:4'-phosphopantetheinyl transferase superfamily protein [Candidatus Nomurabacteria bacterium]|nr:4'-phosphopantetheinyl transferase superfamily protein [Candidatus Nomurabacteria bacterium]
MTLSEQNTYHKKNQSTKLCWALGRLAAKKSIQDYFIKIGLEISLLQIEIDNRPTGVPFFRILPSRSGEWKLVSHIFLSISHCKNWAVANCVPTEEIEGLGVDIEKIRDFSDETIRSFLTTEEYELYLKISDLEKPKFATLYWSIKESFLKALGTGIRTHPRHVSIDQSGTNTFTICFSKLHYTKKPIVFYKLLEGSYIMTNTIIPRPQ